MKKLQDYENEIIKCSKCGLCQAVCPIFELTGNECAVSKGKFVMLSGVLKGDLQLSDKIISYIDLCTKCEKCSKFCPAGINAVEIFQCAKYNYLKNKPIFKLLKLFQNPFFTDKLLNFLHKFTHKPTNSNGNTGEILYFKGCVNKIFPQTENALKKLLQKSDVNIVEAEFDCCGLPFYSSGNLERYEEAKNKNIEIIKNSCAKFLLTDCASCENTLKNYNLGIPILKAEDFISTLDLKFQFPKNLKIAYHKPCHADNTDFLNKILKNNDNIEFINIPETCCGLAGEFCIKNHKLSAEISKKRADEIIQSGAEIILTSCPLCEIGLKKALWSQKNFKIKVMNTLQFLNKFI